MAELAAKLARRRSLNGEVEQQPKKTFNAPSPGRTVPPSSKKLSALPLPTAATMQTNASEMEVSAKPPGPKFRRESIRNTEDVNWLYIDKHYTLRVGKDDDENANVDTVFNQAKGKPVNNVMIFGKIGEGKSFLMNRLAQEDVFGVSGQSKSFTQGVNVGPRLLEHPAKPQEFPMISFSDAEGQGDGKGKGYELKLATPLLLTSKVAIMNIKNGRPNKDELDRLDVLLKTAKCLKSKNQTNALGHLYIVFRDVELEKISEEECHKILMGQEDCDELEGVEYDLAEKRNDIRDDLQTYFDSVSVVALPHPFYCEDQFDARVSKMRDSMMKNLETPKLFAGNEISGSNISIVVDELVSKLNDSKNQDGDGMLEDFLNPPNMMTAIYTKQAKKVENLCKLAAEEDFNTFILNGPISNPDLIVALETKRKQYELDLATKLKEQIDGKKKDKIIEDAKEDFKTFLDKIVALVKSENEKCLLEAKNAAKADVHRLKKEMESSVENFFGDLECPTDKEQLESNLQDRAIIFQSEFAEKLQLLENDMIDEECLSNAKNEFQSFLDQNVSNSTALNSQILAELKSKITTEVQNKKDSARANIDTTLSAWRKEIGEFEEAELSNFLSELCSLEVLVEAKASVVDDTEKGSFELQMFEDEFDDAISELEAHFASIQIAVNNEFGAEKERRKKEREQEEQRKRDAEEAARKLKELEEQRKRDAEETARKVKELEEQKKEAARKLEELEEQRKREAREAEERRKREAREAEERRRNWSPPVQTYHQPWAPAPAPAPAPRRNVILKKDGTPDRRYKGQRNMY